MQLLCNKYSASKGMLVAFKAKFWYSQDVNENPI